MELATIATAKKYQKTKKREKVVAVYNCQHNADATMPAANIISFEKALIYTTLSQRKEIPVHPPHDFLSLFFENKGARFIREAV
ncbi:Uncharacterized protein TCM_020817 [Theobroma cacao]|uniref:Uncharacterized protein n=1 Tax=Theobroma cacao TaxID=3641 RepID=A0A061ELM9_THECC|nr:Uncharacterized protein TCM_020817 [Theobroma cacao]